MELRNRIKKRKQKLGNICQNSSHIPNEKTVRAIKEAKAGKDLIHYTNPKDFFKKFGE